MLFAFSFRELLVIIGNEYDNEGLFYRVVYIKLLGGTRELFFLSLTHDTIKMLLVRTGHGPSDAVPLFS